MRYYRPWLTATNLVVLPALGMFVEGKHSMLSSVDSLALASISTSIATAIPGENNAWSKHAVGENPCFADGADFCSAPDGDGPHKGAQDGAPLRASLLQDSLAASPTVATSASGAQYKDWPSGIHPSMAPSGTPPPGAQCTATLDGSYQLEVTYMSAVEAGSKYPDLTTQHAVFITLKDGVLVDQDGRVGVIVSNHRFQFDGPPQSETIYTAGWSVCGSGLSLFLGGNSTFQSCNSGTFANLYDYNDAEQCRPIHMALLNADDLEAEGLTERMNAQPSTDANEITPENTAIANSVTHPPTTTVLAKREDTLDGPLGNSETIPNAILTTATYTVPAVTVVDPGDEDEPGATFTVEGQIWIETQSPAPLASADQINKRQELVPLPASLFADLDAEDDDGESAPACNSTSEGILVMVVTVAASSPSASISVNATEKEFKVTAMGSSAEIYTQTNASTSSTTATDMAVQTEEVTVLVPPPFSSEFGASYTTRINPIATEYPAVCKIGKHEGELLDCIKNYTITTHGQSTSLTPMSKFNATGLSSWISSATSSSSRKTVTSTKVIDPTTTTSGEPASSTTADLSGGAQAVQIGGSKLAAQAAAAMFLVFSAAAYFL